MDEYLQGIMKREDTSSTREWLASFSGFRIVQDARIAKGCVELRNDDGEVIALIAGVAEVRLAQSRS